MIARDWWSMDLAEVSRKMEQNLFPGASTINGKLGDLFNCSGTVLLLRRSMSKTISLLLLNGKLSFLKGLQKIRAGCGACKDLLATHNKRRALIRVLFQARHIFTVTTPTMSAPTLRISSWSSRRDRADALVVADVTPGKYYMFTVSNQAPLLDTETSGLGKKRRTGQLVGRSHGRRADGGNLGAGTRRGCHTLEFPISWC
jgi:laccase